jgi:tetratricopeptide (TPR) repeat protein
VAVAAPVVFISYSHDSEEHRETVLRLAQRLRNDGFDAWVDQYVNGTPEQGWPRWMLDQLDEADFVLAVCTETYYRRFRGREAPGKGKGADWEGALITQEIYDARSRTVKFVPVALTPGQEGFIPEPLRGHTHYALTSEERYEELRAFLLGGAGVEPRQLGDLRPVTQRTVEPLTFGPGPGRRVAPSKLRHTADRLFGREDELTALDAAWADPAVHVVTLVAWGGVGKTSLVSKWVAGLAARDHDGADYFDWSFYSQGTREQSSASADPFVDAALRVFGDEAMADSPRSPWDKGARLAQLVAARRTLLVLDGLEPLQHPPGPLAGELKDPAITALLKGLAARNAGLCVVTTRERVQELGNFEGATALRWDLDRLSTPAGVALLESLGVHGAAAELESLVEEVRGHALSLSLLGGYLRGAHGGDVRKRDLVRFEEADAEIRGGHAFRVMEAYERWFAGEGEKGERPLAILHLLGLFDRPAAAELLAVLRSPPAIPGLTDALASLSDPQWNLAVARLAECGLAVQDGETLDAHPLVREHFGRRLRERSPDAWQAAHGRLFDHLKARAEHRPDTLEGLQPLYQAVVHGCQAGRQQEACDEVYAKRILRGTGSDGFYSTKNLGASGADLGAVGCFFDPPWSRVSPALTETHQAWLLNQAAVRLRSMGRLTEAVEPMLAGLRMRVGEENWTQAAISASNLSELELMLGDMASALQDAEQSVVYADRSCDLFRRLVQRGALADALHQAERREEAMGVFREAEAMQAEAEPGYPLLYSVRGFGYCELLLAGAERAAGGGPEDHGAGEACDKVERRAAQTLEWVERHQLALLDIALDHLTLGRARLYRAILGGSAPAAAEPEIDQAVDGLRRAGQLDYLPRGLLTRAWLSATQGRPDDARADLAEAEEIAERGPMPLHLADVHLYRARLFHDRAALAEARRLVDKHGYHRRREELEDLEKAAPEW